MFETFEEAVQKWQGKKIRVTMGLWEPGKEPEALRGLGEKMQTRARVHGVVKQLRPAIAGFGRSQWEFLVLLDDQSEWWLPRGAFEPTAHAKRRLEWRTQETLVRARELNVKLAHEEKDRTIYTPESGLGKELQTIESDAQLAEAEGERVMKELEKVQEQQKENK